MQTSNNSKRRPLLSWVQFSLVRLVRILITAFQPTKSMGNILRNQFLCFLFPYCDRYKTTFRFLCYFALFLSLPEDLNSSNVSCTSSVTVETVDATEEGGAHPELSTPRAGLTQTTGASDNGASNNQLPSTTKNK